MQSILLATANAHKVHEIEGLLAECGVRVLSLRDFPDIELPEETGATMRENARLKAQHAALQSGVPCLADDSGIEVDALDGAPGVHSARWVVGSDQDRNAALLEKMHGVPDEFRTARYRCALCLSHPQGVLWETEATCEGKIAFIAEGAQGFGYDPIFVLTPASGAPLDCLGKTMAQVEASVKACISHRARALAQLKEKLQTVR